MYPFNISVIDKNISKNNKINKNGNKNKITNDNISKNINISNIKGNDTNKNDIINNNKTKIVNNNEVVDINNSKNINNINEIIDNNIDESIIINNSISYNKKNDNYEVADYDGKLLNISKKQLAKIINNILKKTYEKLAKIIDVNELINKLRNNQKDKNKFIETAEPFYKIMYDKEKLKFIINCDDTNILNKCNLLIHLIAYYLLENPIVRVDKDGNMLSNNTFTEKINELKNHNPEQFRFAIDIARSYEDNLREFKCIHKNIISESKNLDSCFAIRNIKKLIRIVESNEKNKDLLNDIKLFFYSLT